MIACQVLIVGPTVYSSSSLYWYLGPDTTAGNTVPVTKQTTCAVIDSMPTMYRWQKHNYTVFTRYCIILDSTPTLIYSKNSYTLSVLNLPPRRPDSFFPRKLLPRPSAPRVFFSSSPSRPSPPFAGCISASAFLSAFPPVPTRQLVELNRVRGLNRVIGDSRVGRVSQVTGKGCE